MAAIDSPRGTSNEVLVPSQNLDERGASKKRCETITTIVILLLLIVSICLSEYFTVCPYGPTIPNTTLSIPLLVSLSGTLGFGIGFLILFIRCVNTHKFLNSPYLDRQIAALEKEVAMLKQHKIDLEANGP